MSAPFYNQEEWLKLRGKKIGSSNAAAACGESRSVSRMELWAQLTGRIPSTTIFDQELLFWGHALEPTICEIACYRFGLAMIDVDTPEGREEMERLVARDNAASYVAGWIFTEHPGLKPSIQAWVLNHRYPHMAATLDYQGTDREGGLWIVEAKNQGHWRTREWIDDSDGDDDEDDAPREEASDTEMPQEYRLQQTHHAAVVETAKGVLLAALVGGNRFKLRPNTREKLPIGPLIELESEFWGYIERDERPPVDEIAWKSVDRTLRKLHPDDNGDVITMPEQLEELMAERDQCKVVEQAGSAAKKRRSQIDVHFKDALGSATFGLLRDGRSFSYRTQERGPQGPKKYRVLKLHLPPKLGARRK